VPDLQQRAIPSERRRHHLQTLRCAHVPGQDQPINVQVVRLQLPRWPVPHHVRRVGSRHLRAVLSVSSVRLLPLRWHPVPTHRVTRAHRVRSPQPPGRPHAQRATAFPRGKTSRARAAASLPPFALGRSTRPRRRRPPPTASAPRTRAAAPRSGGPRLRARTATASARTTPCAHPRSGRPRQPARTTTACARTTPSAVRRSGRPRPPARTATVCARTTPPAARLSGRPRPPALSTTASARRILFAARPSGR